MSRSYRNRILGILAMAAAAGVLIVIALLARGKSKEGIVRHSFAMGSAVTLTLYGDEKDLEGIAEIAEKEIKTLDEEILSHRIPGSELSRWNREAAAGEKVKISTRLHQALSEGILIYESGGHVLDLTLRPVLDVWGIEDKTAADFRVPSEEELSQALEKTGMENLHIEDDGLVRDREDITLDLGAVGKGYALDAVYDKLTSGEGIEKPYFVPGDRKNQVMGGVIAVGGSVMVFGEKPDGKDFRVGIRDPEGLPENTVGIISFPSGTKKMCMSTSGGYEKYIEKDGVKYHHIIDPRTGKPSDSGLRSVTVVCENGLLSDGLSTACFILGVEDGKKLLEKMSAEGVFLLEDGGVVITDGLKDRVVMQ